MQREHNKYCYALFFSVLVTVYLLSVGGIWSPEWSFYRICDLIKLFSNENNPDIYLQWFNTSTPLFYYLFYAIHDIPLAHLLLGFLVTVGTYFVFYCIVFKVFEDHLIAIVSLLLLFVLPDGAASLDINHSIAFSARSFGYLLAVIALYFFVDQKYLLSSLSLGMASVFQLLNWFPLFVVLTLFLVIKSNRSIKNTLVFIVPCTLMIILFMLYSGSSGMSSTDNLISVKAWWNFIIALEPDDVTVTWWLSNLTTQLLLAISLILVVIYPFFSHKKRNGDIFWALLIVSLVFTLGLFLYEQYLIFYMPDWFNDYYIAAQLRRVLTLPAIFNSILAAVVMTRTIQYLVSRLNSKPIFNQRVVPLISIVLIALMFAGKTYIQQETMDVYSGMISMDYITKYIDIKHRPYSYFVEAKGSFFKGSAGENRAYDQLCFWLDSSLPHDAKLIIPPDLNSLALDSKRQWFITERLDGHASMYSRAYATLYFERFKELFQNKTETELFAILANKGGNENKASVLSSMYADLPAEAFKRIHHYHPEFGYAITTKKQRIELPLVYSNQEYTVYKL